jgi:hypothetical protein
MRRLSWVGRLTAAAAGTLLIGAAASPPPAAQSPQACRVEFTKVNEITYGPENLKGLVLEGHHTVPARPGSASDSPTAFNVMDLDGFFTMAVLVNQWRSSGAFDRNLTESVVVPRRDVQMLAAIADNGVTYHTVVLVRIRTLNDPSLEWYKKQIEDKRDKMRSVQATAATALDQGDLGSSVILPRGVMSNLIGVQLDRFFSPDESNRLISQYRDLALGESPQIFCNPDAGSSTVGQVFCGFVFSTGARRDPAFCPEGLLVSEIAPVRFCKLAAGVESDCRTSVYP